MEVSQIRTPKSFYVQERDRLYADWQESIWRELFQNSVDAGAKEIQIGLRNAPGKGSFGRAPLVDEVIRIDFDDDGCGMDAQIIDEVYFRPGESTKRGGDSIGGYGRARLMSCFAQAQFSIVTQDRAVEGDGPEYAHHSIEGMIVALDGLIRQLAPDATDPDVARQIADIEAEQGRLRAIAAGGPVAGCRIEIDVNPKEYPESSWRNPSLDKLSRTLSEYLSMSQIPCKVFVNGEERKERLLKGPIKRTLSATGDDGIEKAFATVHHSRGDKAAHKGKIIVRVDGATMFTDTIHNDVQVVLELDKEVARDVLTANRDGLRNPYKAAYEAFKDEIVVDVRTALDDRKRDSRTVPGALGRLRARPPAQEIDIDPKDRFDEHRVEDEDLDVAPLAGASTLALSELERNGFAGVPYPVLRRFFEKARYGDTFLSDHGLSHLGGKLRDALSGRHGIAMVRSGLEAMSDKQRAYVLSKLSELLEERRAQERESLSQKLAGLPDVRVQTHGEVTGKLRDAMRRNDPRNWDPATGRGQRPRGILAAWTILCEEAISTLMRYHPEAAGDDLEWSPGFLYSPPEAEYRNGRSNEASTREAEYSTSSEGNFILINPVDSDGNLKYNPRSPSDLQYMASLAAHEVAHVAEKWHNEDFASLLTTIVGRMDVKGANTRIRKALDEIRDIYRKGRVHAQAMDDEPGVRPSERLLANAAPATTIAAGVMASPENRHLASAVASGLAGAATRNPDGTTTYDGARIAAMEQAIEERLAPTLEEGYDAPTMR